MSSGITLWIRANHADSSDAQAFLRHHKYAADRIRTLPMDPPTGVDLDRLCVALGGTLNPAVDGRHPQFSALFPGGAGEMADGPLRDILAANPDLFKAPILVTPKGALAGFREQKWRTFLDIGKGR